VQQYKSYIIGENHMDSKTATVYTGPRCVWCDRVKTLLKDNDYEVTEKSITDRGLIEEFQNKFNQTLRTVPQVVIGDELIGGFSETEAKMQGLTTINGI
jgi:glutaredoxin